MAVWGSTTRLRAREAAGHATACSANGRHRGAAQSQHRGGACRSRRFDRRRRRGCFVAVYDGMPYVLGNDAELEDTQMRKLMLVAAISLILGGFIGIYGLRARADAATTASCPR